MKKEVVSNKQGIALIVTFIIGSSSIYVMGLEAKRDVWLAVLLSIFMAFPVILIYARIHYIFPDKNLYDVIEICFGKFIGKGIEVIYVLFLIDTGAAILRNYGNFISTVSLYNTPLIIPMICLGILCIWGAKEGIETLGRWAQLFFILPIALILIIALLLSSRMDINNIRPVFYNAIKPIFKGAFGSFSFPFAQVLPLTMIFSSFRRKKDYYKVYSLGLLIGGMVLFITSLTNVLVLGVNEITRLNFPTYALATRLGFSRVLNRMEVIPAILFILGGFVKISIYLIAICKGIEKIFKCPDYRFIVFPISLLVINQSYLSFDSIMYYFEWSNEVWIYYVFPFHVIIPIIIWITAEFKKKRLNKV
ncbi:endospore germination permease [Wukongibacter baidiensis]|uniref:GerAB/ArcD/ProY family transporter n=1 Tax=Wukongibacter baidiensis TaxID=1723361 RepID=UPI003D7F51BE